MSKELHYLQPKTFAFEHEGFNYEVIACHEYFADFADGGENTKPGDLIDFTGNYLITILTPEGTKQTVIDRSGDSFSDEFSVLSKEVSDLILKQIME